MTIYAILYSTQQWCFHLSSWMKHILVFLHSFVFCSCQLSQIINECHTLFMSENTEGKLLVSCKILLVYRLQYRYPGFHILCFVSLKEDLSITLYIYTYNKVVCQLSYFDNALRDPTYYQMLVYPFVHCLWFLCSFLSSA